MALATSFHFQSSNTKMKIPLSLPSRSPSFLGFKGLFPYSKADSCDFSLKPNRIFQNNRPNLSCGINMAAGQSNDPDKINFDHIVNKARKIWDRSPQPVKSFPWNRTLENFILLILDLIVAVVKYLCIPLLGVTSLSEMSYCAHQKKLFLVPFPLLIGVAIAGVLKETALELSPRLKDAEVPWHLIAVAIFFTLIKLPGPYYPYWGRVVIPHLANGVLWKTVWFVFVWYRRPRKASGENLRHS